MGLLHYTDPRKMPPAARVVQDLLDAQVFGDGLPVPAGILLDALLEARDEGEDLGRLWFKVGHGWAAWTDWYFGRSYRPLLVVHQAKNSSYQYEIGEQTWDEQGQPVEGLWGMGKCPTLEEAQAAGVERLIEWLGSGEIEEI